MAMALVIVIDDVVVMVVVRGNDAGSIVVNPSPRRRR